MARIQIALAIGGTVAFSLTSPSFQNNGPMPRQNTCEGQDVSPELAWSSVPPGAKSLALIVEDPDAPDPKAPKMTWTHWILYDLPASTRGLAAKMSGEGLPPGTRQGKNDWKQTGYRGPCPPIGRHRYFFKLYALDAQLGDLQEPNREKLLKALSGHVVGTAELVGTYAKGR